MARTKNSQPMVKKTSTKTTTKRDPSRNKRPVAKKHNTRPVATKDTSRPAAKPKRKSVNTEIGGPAPKRTRRVTIQEAIQEVCESSSDREVQESSSAREVSSSDREVPGPSSAREVSSSDRGVPGPSSAREREVQDEPADGVQPWALNFRTLESSMAFAQDYEGRSIITGRRFDADYLLECGDWDLLQSFADWGWLGILGLKRHSYTDLVRYFYFNASLQRHDEEGNPLPRTLDKTGFTTFLKGRTVRVTDRDVWEVLGGPRTRSNAPVYDNKSYNALRDYRLVFNDPTLQRYVQKDANASRLSFWNRILHFMVCQTFNPRRGSYSVVTKEDLWLMGNILRGTPPNLAALVMKKIKRTIKFNKNRGTNRGLLYGKVVSEIIDSKGLPGVNGEKTMTDTVLPFNAKTITQTGFRYDDELQDWVKGANEDQEAEDQFPVNADEEVPLEDDDSENEAEDADMGGHGGGVPVQEAGVPAAVMEELRVLRREASQATKNTERILKGMEQLYKTINHVVYSLRDIEKVIQGSSQPTNSHHFNEEQVNTAAANDDDPSPTADPKRTDDAAKQVDEEEDLDAEDSEKTASEQEVEAAATVPSGNARAEKHVTSSPAADLLAGLCLSESPLPSPSRPQTQEPNTEKAANSPPSASDQPTATHGKT